VAKGIPPLPGARAEGRSVAGRFHAAAILEGSDASRQAALRMLAGHQVLHIAAHAVPHRDLSGAASILMAGDTDGSWRADDIASRRFADLRLVVLSSCESAIGFPTTLSGPMSIGQAFLTAGAEYVLVTQWPVEDRVSRRFMETFYDQLEIMGSPERALAEAQRRFKSSPNAVDRRPKSWAGYSVATGNAGRSSAGKESS
jgi:CHAT domain-containing protein